MRVAAILLGAGRGVRLGDAPKAFVKIGGRSMLELAVRTVEACPRVESFVAAVPQGLEERALALMEASPKLHAVVAGGKSRQDTVWVALRRIQPEVDIVVPHDVARPFASPDLFARVIAAVESAEGAVPAVAVTDTVKRVQGDRVVQSIPRDDLVAVQTPQAFRRRALEEAHRRASAEGFRATDDAALLEWAGVPVAVVPGERLNAKVTEPGDLRMARALAGALRS